MRIAGSRRSGRRRYRIRRLFFYGTSLLGLLAFAAAPQADIETTAEILERRINLSRGLQADYRVIESIHIEVAAPDSGPLPLESALPLLQLPEAALDVEGWGAGLAVGQVRYDPPRLQLLGPAVPARFQVLVRYRLPAATPALGIRSELPVERLVLEVARGSVRGRPDPPLVREGQIGSTERPYWRYSAGPVEHGDALRYRFQARRSATRSRLAVLLAVASLAALAGAWVWRGGRGVAAGAAAGRAASSRPTPGSGSP